MTDARKDAFVVSGLSAISAVGHSAAISYTSVRAGLSRLGESPELKIRDAKGKLMNVTCAAVSGIADGQRRYLRHYRLAVRAFAEAMSHAKLDGHLLGETELFLALAEPNRPGMDDRVLTHLVPKMCTTLGLADLSPRTAVLQAGHAGIFNAVKAAAQRIASGHCQHVIIGAVDGYLDELTLTWLHDTGRLKTEDNPKGFVPGEASAFLVVEQLSTATARRGRALARLTGVGTTTEAANMYEKTPCAGVGLTDAIRAALAHADAATPLALVVCDLNGERYRANEWGMALTRGFGKTAPPLLWHPADCLGDCGAAAGALNLVFSTLALARHNVPEGDVMVWGSSDDGERGAALLATVTGFGQRH